MAVKRALLAGLFAGIVAFLFNLLTNTYLFSWVYLVVPADIWKPMAGTWYIWMAVTALVYGMILSFIYTILQESMLGIRLSKGAMFGLMVWLVAGLPTGLNNLLTTKLATFVIGYNVVSSLVLSVLLGIVIAETVTEKGAE